MTPTNKKRRMIMNDIIIRILACCIPSSGLRRRFRKKYMLEHKVKSLQENIHNLSDTVQTMTQLWINPTSMPPAQGSLRAVQLLSLDILKDIDKVCKKNKIKYWIDFGTLLGAVRHKGFIPWDDDIDISMEASDFEKFCKIAEKELKGTKCVFRKAPCNIVKILHIEFAPKTDSDLLGFFFHRSVNRLTFTVDVFPYYRTDANKEDIEKAIIKGGEDKYKILGQGTSFEDLKIAQQVVEKTNNLFANKNGKKLFLGLETVCSKPCIYEYDDIFPLRQLEFEGFKVPAPNRANKVLTHEYGNYWAPPLFTHHHVYLQNLDEDEINKLEKYIEYEKD